MWLLTQFFKAKCPYLEICSINCDATSTKIPGIQLMLMVLYVFFFQTMLGSNNNQQPNFLTDEGASGFIHSFFTSIYR